MDNETKAKEASVLFSFNVGRHMFKMHVLPKPGWTPEVLRGYNAESWRLYNAISADSPEAALALADAMI